MEYEQVFHTIEPLFDAQSKVLILGSIPSPDSRKAQFFYGHPQNRFWRVLAAVLGVPAPETVAQKTALAHGHGIALWDALASCEIIGASDAAIRNPVGNDIAGLLRKTEIHSIFCTGAASHKWYTKLCRPAAGIDAVQLPSTSPANAAWSLERLIEAYAVIGQALTVTID